MMTFADSHAVRNFSGCFGSGLGSGSGLLGRQSLGFGLSSEGEGFLALVGFSEKLSSTQVGECVSPPGHEGQDGLHVEEGNVMVEDGGISEEGKRWDAKLGTDRGKAVGRSWTAPG